MNDDNIKSITNAFVAIIFGIIGAFICEYLIKSIMIAYILGVVITVLMQVTMIALDELYDKIIANTNK